MTASQSKWTRVGVIVVLLLIGAAYLIGFWPQYRKTSELQQQLAAERERVQTLQNTVAISKTRDLASVLYLELTRKNFGNAQRRATAMFDQIRSASSALPAGQARQALDQIQSRRDEIVAAIAKADPAVEAQVAGIVEQLHTLDQP